jgi:hypothetical protein
VIESNKHKINFCSPVESFSRMSQEDNNEIKRLKLAMEQMNQQLKAVSQKLEMKDQEIERKVQEIEMKDQEIEMKDQEIEMKDQEIEMKDQEIEMKDQKLEEQNTEIRLLKKIQKSALLRTANITAFRDAESCYLDISEQIFSKFPWQGPNSAEIQSAWDYIRTLENIPDEGSSIENENKALHGIFLDIFSCLKYKLNLSPDAKLFHEVSMPDDGVRHDYVLSNKNLKTTGYPDVSAIIEIKLPNVNKAMGEMQACRGLVNAIMNSNVDGFRINKVSLFFDFESVKAYYFEDENLEVGYRSQNCSCFPENWKDLQTPPLGFQILCHVLSVPIQGLHKVKLENGTNVKCATTIFSTSNYAVYVLNNNELPTNIPRDREYVVKVLTKKDKHIEALMRLEHNKNKVIYEFDDFREYSVFSPELKIKDGFAMVKGTPLLVASKAARKTAGLDLFNLLKKSSMQLFTAIFILHSHGWFHGDIRPYNIVLDNNNNVKLIDFMTADIFETILRCHFMQGQYDAFWADQMMECGDKPHIYDPRWEYESLVYSILYCALRSEDSEKVFKTVDSRREFLISTCKTSPRSILRFCALFFSLIESLGTSVPDQAFRDSVLSALNNFVYESQ